MRLSGSIWGEVPQAAIMTFNGCCLNKFAWATTFAALLMAIVVPEGVGSAESPPAWGLLLKWACSQLI